MTPRFSNKAEFSHCRHSFKGGFVPLTRRSQLIWVRRDDCRALQLSAEQTGIRL